MSIAPPVPVTAAVQTVTFSVGKMDCAACSGQVVDALKKTPGVALSALVAAAMAASGAAAVGPYRFCLLN